MEKATVDAKVQKLALAYNQWEEDRWRMGRRKATLQQRLAWIDNSMPAIEADAKLAAETPTDPAVKPLGGICRQAFAGTTGAAMCIGAGFKAMVAAKVDGPMAEVNGFQLHVARGYLAWDLEVVPPNSGLRAKVERPNMNDVVGVGLAVLKSIGGIANDPRKLREEYGGKTEELASVDKMLAEDFEQRDALAQARARQAEIEAMLDLDKATTGTQAMDAESS